MPGYVYKIVINRKPKVNYVINTIDNQFHKNFSTVNMYAGDPLIDAFSTNIGNIWGIKVNGESIKGKYQTLI